MLRKESKQINLSSQSATKYLNGFNKSYVEYSFPNFIKPDENIYNISVSVQNASIPVSFYTIDHRNMSFEYSFDNINKVKIDFTHGNYNANTFITEFKSKTPFNITFNKSNGLFTFTHDTQNFYFHKENSTCFKILGFDKDVTYESTFNTLFAPFLADFSGIRIIKIRSNTLITNNADSNVGNYSGDICSISVTVGSYGIINYVNYNNFASNITNRHLSLFDIQILDEYDEQINFNNIDWAITLQFDIESWGDTPKGKPRVSPPQLDQRSSTRAPTQLNDIFDNRILEKEEKPTEKSKDRVVINQPLKEARLNSEKELELLES